ncbi:hypothetical protein I4I80_04065 [Pseudomonas syringae pv. tomato]|nr:hypothetical protein [Pseudomonas syringae pv. tomato]
MSNEYKRPAVVLTEEMKRAARNATLPMVFLDSISARQDLEFESKFYAAIAAAPQPPATELVAAGLNLQLIVTEALIGMIAAVTSTSPPANEPPPAFIQAGIDRAVSRISAHLAPLQAEIERQRQRTVRACQVAIERSQQKKASDAEVIQLKALLVLANAALEGRIDAALSKPAASEQV